MNRWQSYLLALLALGGITFALSSCAEDNLSIIGESIQPGQDKVIGRGTTIELEAQTIATPTLYTDGTRSLLGELIDHSGQPIRGEFIKQIRTAPGLTFDSVGPSTRVDSVELRLFYDEVTGNTNSSIKVNVYRLASPVNIHGTTSESLASYGDDDRLLASATLTPSAGLRMGEGTSTRMLSVRLPREVGQSILEASRSDSQRGYFATQALFDEHIFPGFYVTPTTGQGFLLHIERIALVLHYSTPVAGSSATPTARTLAFIDTRQTGRLNALTSGDVSTYTTPSADYTFIKGPAGVTTRYTISVAQLQRLLQTVPAPRQTPAPANFIGRSWMLANARFSVPVSKPEGQLTNEPSRLLLLPTERARSFFVSDIQEIRAGNAYISEAYNPTEQQYHFNNIAQIVTEHLAAHATYSASGGWTISTPLSLELVPVTFVQSGSTTASVTEQVSPSFVRLSKAADAMRLTFVSVQIQQ